MQENRNVITVVDETGHQQDLRVLGVVNIHERDYAVLSDEESVEQGIYVLRVENDTLAAIEDEDEFNHVVAHLQGNAEH